MYIVHHSILKKLRTQLLLNGYQLLAIDDSNEKYRWQQRHIQTCSVFSNLLKGKIKFFLYFSMESMKSVIAV